MTYLDDVDVVKSQQLETFVDALLDPLGREVEHSLDVLLVAPDLRADVVSASRDVLQSLS